MNERSEGVEGVESGLKKLGKKLGERGSRGRLYLNFHLINRC